MQIMGKIYFSHIEDPKTWVNMKYYSFPFAKTISGLKYGWAFLEIYLKIRWKLERTFK